MQQIDARKILQTSPVADAEGGETKWQLINGMNIAVEFASAEVERARKQVLGVADLSCLSRYGVKGQNAMQWLENRGVAIPTSPNAWTTSEQNALVLRLGASEFLIEDQLSGGLCAKLATDSTRVTGVYKVPRADANFVVSGSETLNLFSELCALDLSEQSLANNQLIMTQVAGISATVIRQTLNGQSAYRIWCDGTYGSSMWEVLIEIATALGGGAIGLLHYQS